MVATRGTVQDIAHDRARAAAATAAATETMAFAVAVGRLPSGVAAGRTAAATQFATPRSRAVQPARSVPRSRRYHCARRAPHPPACSFTRTVAPSPLRSQPRLRRGAQVRCASDASYRDDKNGGEGHGGGNGNKGEDEDEDEDEDDNTGAGARHGADSSNIEALLSNAPRSSSSSGSGDDNDHEDRGDSGGSGGSGVGEFRGALESLFLEALRSYYEGNPVLTDAEFKTLRDELEHLGSSSVRLNDLEKVWVQATQQRDFDRKLRREFRMSKGDLARLKEKLGAGGTETIDAQGVINSDSRVDQRLLYLLFDNAAQDRLKIALLYAPAVLLCVSVLLGAALLDLISLGHVQFSYDEQFRARAPLLAAMATLGTLWFANYLTPRMLSYLDLGSPHVVRGPCPNCKAPVTCLFTSSAGRKRDERKCKRCGALVGFNVERKKVFLVARPADAGRKSKPD